PRRTGGRRLLELVATPSGEDHGISYTHQRQRDLAPDAAAGTGHHRDLVLTRHGCPLLCDAVSSYAKPWSGSSTLWCRRGEGAVAPAEPAHGEGHGPGIAAIERHGGKRRAVVDRLAFRQAQDLQGELVAEVGAHGHAGEVIAHGVPDAVRLADMGHHVEGRGTLPRPHMAEARTCEVGQHAAEDRVQAGGGLCRGWKPPPPPLPHEG